MILKDLFEQVLVDPSTRVAFGVQYVREGKIQVARATKEVILSGGTVGSPQILMLSGTQQTKRRRCTTPCLANIVYGKAMLMMMMV